MRRSPLLRLAAVALLTAAGACDRVKSALHPPEYVDTRWQGDSSLLAARPNVVFRIDATDRGDRVVPVAAIGDGGFRLLGFSNRGWRAFDIAYMQRDQSLMAHRMGRVVGRVTMQRGMWDPPTDPLDTVANCPVLVPAALARVGGSATLLTSAPPPPLRATRTLSGGELESELSKITTLIAPTLGVGPSALARFSRQVYQLQTGVQSDPTIVAVYNDPEGLSDTAATIAQRPRHLVVILDKGQFGYRMSYHYTTIGNIRTPPRFYFVDYLDVDADGKAELFFGVHDPRVPSLYTVVLRHDGEAWREMIRYTGSRCQS